MNLKTLDRYVELLEEKATLTEVRRIGNSKHNCYYGCPCERMDEVNILLPRIEKEIQDIRRNLMN